MGQKDILIAFDGSEHALRAVTYAATRFALKDVKITLLYVLPNIPPEFWDDGHILSTAEKEERQRVVDRWFANQKAVLLPLFGKARGIFNENGIGNEQVEAKMVSDVTDVAEAVLEVATAGGYGTVVIGRRPATHKARGFAGSVVTALLNRAHGLAVCVVE
ncbi:MAG TPA: universal stress protein [Syntrophorhabdaceae bacterium]|jgi:nucleotide-binding universal stress UspA family protein